MNEQIFIDALTEKPDDKTTWLAWADWCLEQNNEARSLALRWLVANNKRPRFEPDVWCWWSGAKSQGYSGYDQHCNIGVLLHRLPRRDSDYWEHTRWFKSFQEATQAVLQALESTFILILFARRTCE